MAVNGILICGLLSACQTENNVSPLESTFPISETTSVSSRETGANYRINHNLVKHGTKKLLYTADGRLSQVVDSPTEYTAYSYGPSTLVATHFKNGQQDNQITYTLDGQGRSVQSKQVNSLGTKTYKYDYNAQGRLVKRYNLNAVNDRHEYEYDANGELAVFKTFDSGNMKGVEILFGYSIPNESMKLDRYPLNSTFLAPLDEFLGIFGDFNKHLVRRITYKACGNNDVVEYVVNYKTNNDGLVTEQSVINMASNAVIIKTASVYSGYGLILAN